MPANYSRASADSTAKASANSCAAFTNASGLPINSPLNINFQISARKEWQRKALPFCAARQLAPGQACQRVRSPSTATFGASKIQRYPRTSSATGRVIRGVSGVRHCSFCARLLVASAHAPIFAANNCWQLLSAAAYESVANMNEPVTHGHPAAATILADIPAVNWAAKNTRCAANATINICNVVRKRDNAEFVSRQRCFFLGDVHFQSPDLQTAPIAIC